MRVKTNESRNLSWGFFQRGQIWSLTRCMFLTFGLPSRCCVKCWQLVVAIVPSYSLLATWEMKKFPSVASFAKRRARETGQLGELCLQVRVSGDEIAPPTKVAAGVWPCDWAFTETSHGHLNQKPKAAPKFRNHIRRGWWFCFLPLQCNKFGQLESLLHKWNLCVNDMKKLWGGYDWRFKTFVP